MHHVGLMRQLGGLRKTPEAAGGHLGGGKREVITRLKEVNFRLKWANLILRLH